MKKGEISWQQGKDYCILFNIIYLLLLLLLLILHLFLLPAVMFDVAIWELFRVIRSMEEIKGLQTTDQRIFSFLLQPVLAVANMSQFFYSPQYFILLSRLAHEACEISVLESLTHMRHIPIVPGTLGYGLKSMQLKSGRKEPRDIFIVFDDVACFFLSVVQLYRLESISSCSND